jgi:uncharacterized protein (TIGR02001 family)
MSLNKVTLALTLAIFALPLSAMAQDTSTGTDTTPPADAAANANNDTTPPADAAANANNDATPPADAAANANNDTTPPADASTEATPAAEAPATADTAAAAPAEAPASNLTWNLSVTSDYVFRGISQSNRKPALQGGFDYSFGDSGFYAGTWGSNIDFQDRNGPDVEIDFYTGWNHDISDKWNGDISVIRYTYYGARPVYGSVDYNEFIGKLAWNKMLTLTVGYANDYANYGYSSLYTGLDGSWDVGNGFTFNAGVGHTSFGQSNGSYNDWLLGVSKQFGPVQATLNYFDTNTSGPRLSDSLVLSFKIGG